MKVAIAAILAATATAFAPAQKPAFESALRDTPFKQMSSSPYEDALGVIQPTGFFDPFYLSYNIGQSTFDRFREAEVKHGRVCMLAVIGYVVPEFYRFPFEIAPGIPCASVPNGLDAIKFIPDFGWWQIIALVGSVDYYGYLQFDIGKIDLDPEVAEQRKLQEIQHGRLAMLAFLELIRHDSAKGADGLDHLITGLPFIYN